MEILLVAPSFDSATKYTFKWSKNVNATYRLEKENAVKEVFDVVTNKKDYDVIIFFSHGNWDRIYGNDGNAIVSTANSSKLNGKKVCAIACRSAKVFGRSDSPQMYYGFNDNFSFIVPSEDIFGDFVSEVANSFYKPDGNDKILKAISNAMDSASNKDYLTVKALEKDISLMTGIVNVNESVRDIRTYELR